MGITAISIRNFRSVKSLNADDLKQINLITGRNNSGKSSFLEALFLSVGISNPQLAVNIHKFRKIFLTDDAEFCYLFPEMSDQHLPYIESVINNEQRALRISPIFDDVQFDDAQDDKGRNGIEDARNGRNKDRIRNQDLSVDSSSIPGEPDEMIGLNFSFEINGEQYRSQLSLSRGKTVLNKHYTEKIPANYLAPGSTMVNLSNRLDKLIFNKKIDRIIASLQEIEPALEDISMGANGMIYADLGYEKLVPVNLMGDGILKILTILVYILEKRQSVLLIDEIENGLHYSSLEILWKAIRRAAKDNDVQIFATTHSDDCIRSFADTFKDGDMAKLVKIERRENLHTIKSLSMNSLSVALDKEFEVR